MRRKYWPRKSGLSLGLGTGVGSSGGYLLNELFSTVLTAGNIHNTFSDPGPGKRTVNDTGSRLSIPYSNILTNSGGGGAHDPGIWLVKNDGTTYTRTAGLLLVWSFRYGGDYTENGFSNNTSGAAQNKNACFYIQGTNLYLEDGAIKYITATIDAIYDRGYAIALGTTGAYFFILDKYGSWKLLDILGTDNTSALYPHISNYGGGGWNSYFFKIPIIGWLPAPLVYDTFVGTWGNATSGFGGDGGYGIGGSGKSWTTQTGVFEIASGKAHATTAPAIATTDSGDDGNVLVGGKLYRAAGNVGIVVRWVDSNNYAVAYHDGTNVAFQQFVGGVESAVFVAAAKAYSAGAELRIIVNGLACRVIYNNAVIGTGNLNAALTTSTLFGIYTSSDNAGNSIDDFKVYALGTSGSYDNTLNPIASSPVPFKAYGYAGNPVLLLGGVGEFDEGALRDPYIWYARGSYWMLYVGLESSSTPWNPSIGLATSPDGYTWTKQGQVIPPNAIPGAWNSGSVFDPAIYYDEVTDELYVYISGTEVATEYYSGPTWIGLLKCAAGTDWTLPASYVYQNNGNYILTMDQAWEWLQGVYACDVQKINGLFYMFYTSNPGGIAYKFGVAVASSPDGPFVKYASNPIADDGTNKEEPMVFQSQGQLFMVCDTLTAYINVYRSKSGSPYGPWELIKKLKNEDASGWAYVASGSSCVVQKPNSDWILAHGGGDLSGDRQIGVATFRLR